MVAQTKHASLDEFLALPDDGNLHEYVRGEVRSMPPPKGQHGLVEIELLSAINRYLEHRAGQLGWVPGHGLRARRRLVGFVAGGVFGLQFSLPDDPHQVRGADGVYVTPEQYARVTWHEGQYFPEVPPLVIEVISPSESATDVNEKVQDYLAGGARRVWCIYAERQRVHIEDAEAPRRVLRRDDILTDEELLPGFALPLSCLFESPDADETLPSDV
ncbi:MAG TPA: Uma2 family endonuclease [Chloroflexota bacterium]|nr:Uma2 family endonuclease [Chloroflexota bacterium]